MPSASMMVMRMPIMLSAVLQEVALAAEALDRSRAVLMVRLASSSREEVLFIHEPGFCCR